VKKYIILFIILIILLILALLFTVVIPMSHKKLAVNAAVLNGPTAIGATPLMQNNDNGTSANNYNFTICSTPDDVVGKITNGEVDIAAIPTNLAAALSNKTNGDIEVLGINTLSVLYILDSTGTVNSMSDLSGKTIYVSGQGAVPEYVIRFILDTENIENVNIQYVTDHAALASMAVSGKAPICMLPEPFVSTVLSKDADFQLKINISDEWNKATQIKYGKAAELPMGVIVARKEFLQNNAKAVDDFMTEYSNSVNYANNNIADTANLAVKYGIMTDASIAAKAIPNCAITWITGSDVKNYLMSFFDVLYNLEPNSIGGTIPGDGFYYTK